MHNLKKFKFDSILLIDKYNGLNFKLNFAGFRKCEFGT